MPGRFKGLNTFYNVIIGACGYKVDQAVYNGEDQNRYCGTSNKKSGICHTEQQKHSSDQWKSHGNMKHCHKKRKEKYHQDLAAYGTSNFTVT